MSNVCHKILDSKYIAPDCDTYCMIKLVILTISFVPLFTVKCIKALKQRILLSNFVNINHFLVIF